MQDHHIPDHILKLAEIARPGMAHQRLFQIIAQTGEGFLLLARIASQKTLRRFNHIIAPLTQRRHMNRHDMEAVE